MAVQNFGTGGGGFQLSPGISVSEIDLTTVVPAVDTTAGAIAGVFRWGPVGQRVLVTSENDLAAKFGKPTNLNAETWFSAANFLSYSNALYVSRAANTSSQFAAVAAANTLATPASANYTIYNEDEYETKADNFGASSPYYVARWAGELGNSLKISVCESADQFTSSVNLNSTSTYSATRYSIETANVAGVGGGYSNGDVLTFSGGGWSSNGKITITSTTATGNVAAISVSNTGFYFGTTPTNPVTPTSVANSTGGTSAGAGATLSLAYLQSTTTGSFAGQMTISVGSSTATVTLTNSAAVPLNDPTPFVSNIPQRFQTGDYITVGDSNVGTQSLKIVKVGSINVTNTASVNTGGATFALTFDQPLKLAENITTNAVTRYWEYYSQVDAAPGRSTYVAVNGNTALQLADATAQKDEMHVVVVDEDGGFTGSPGAVLEVYNGLSRASDSKLSDGVSNYYKTVINNRSNFIWVGSDRAPSNTALNVASATSPLPLTLSFDGGVDLSEDPLAANPMPFSAIAKAYDLFVSPEEIDVSLIITGASRSGINDTQLANYIIDNVAEVRKDCVVFVSPAKNDVVNQQLSAVENITAFRNSLRSSSFAVMDSGYKYQYDKYNDVYRYIPLNGDIAGLCARTDASRDPWFSPAGISRGGVKNIVKLAFNPNKAQRDSLYKNGINPVITEPGQGTILFGDKTLLSKPSAFDRINVRRLFIVLEKAIAQAAKSLLFEFNDEFTRAQFRNLVEPYLRDVQGRRGIYDFRVVCDETNNTAEVIDANRFVGDIYIKPTRSINFIQLNFVAVRSGVEFSEITG